MYRYKHKKSGEVVERPEIWDSAEESEHWTRLGSAEADDIAAEAPTIADDVSADEVATELDPPVEEVDAQELAGGAPDEDLVPDGVPGEAADAEPVVGLDEATPDGDQGDVEPAVEPPELSESMTREQINTIGQAEGVDVSDEPNKKAAIKAIKKARRA